MPFPPCAPPPPSPPPAPPLTLEAALSKMIGVMLNVIAMMIAGYLLAEHKGLTKDARAGLSIYIGFCALPALFFASLAKEDFLETETPVLLAVVLGKAMMILLSCVAGWASQQYRVAEEGAREIRAGIFALLTTNGDEVGLGVPAIGALFPSKLPLLFVLAGLQKLVFLLIALVLLGVGAAKREGARRSPLAILLQVLADKAKDPLVIGIFGGLFYNLVGPTLKPPCGNATSAFSFYGYSPGLLGGATVPSYIESLCTVLGSGFTPTIFVLTGAASVGTWSTLADIGALPVPLVLVLLKSLILPTIVRLMLAQFGASDESLDFVFVFCLFSASGANMVYVLAKHPNEHQKTILMANLALSKIIAFPLLLVASAVLFTKDAAEMLTVLRTVDIAVQPLALLCGIWYLISATCWHDHRPHITWLIFVMCECGFLLASMAAEEEFGIIRIVRMPGAHLFAEMFKWSGDCALLLVATIHLRHLRIDKHGSEGLRMDTSDVDPRANKSMLLSMLGGSGGLASNLEMKDPEKAASTSSRASSRKSRASRIADGGAASSTGLAAASEPLIPTEEPPAVEEPPVGRGPSWFDSETKNAIASASGASTSHLSYSFLTMTLCLTAVPGALLTLFVTSALDVQTDANAMPIKSSQLLPGHLLAYASIYALFSAAFFFCFAVLQHHVGALELRSLNVTYHLFLQRLTILLLVVLTQMLLCAAILIPSSNGDGGNATGSQGVMMLVVAVLKNGRLVFVMLLFGWNRAAMDLQNLYEGVVEGLRDWKLLPREVEDEEEEEAVESQDMFASRALFPPMY